MLGVEDWMNVEGESRTYQKQDYRIFEISSIKYDLKNLIRLYLRRYSLITI